MAFQNIMFLTTCILLFWSVDAKFLRSRAAKVEDEPEKVEVYKPVLSHNFSAYDTNDDDLLDYEEFVFPFMEKFKISNLEDIREDFFAADKDDDGKLNREEFADFPLFDAATEEGKASRRCRLKCGLKCLWLIFKCKWGCWVSC